MNPYNNSYGPSGYSYQNNPYYNPYTMNNMQNVYSQQNYQPYNNQMQQSSIQQSDNAQQIIMCDSRNFVDSQNVRMDGGSTYYALTNGKALYCKKLNPMTGSSVVQEYRLVETNENELEQKVIDNNQIGNMISQLQNEFVELKNLVLENLTSPNTTTAIPITVSSNIGKGQGDK